MDLAAGPICLRWVICHRKLLRLANERAKDRPLDLPASRRGVSFGRRGLSPDIGFLALRGFAWSLRQNWSIGRGVHCRRIWFQPGTCFRCKCRKFKESTDGGEGSAGCVGGFPSWMAAEWCTVSHW